MKPQFEMAGVNDMKRNLAGLKAGTQKAVVRRSMKKILKPVADRAEASNFTIAITSSLSETQSKSEPDRFARHVVAMYVGPVDDDGQGAPHAHLVEFGTGPRFHKSGKFVGAVMADPFMRPAWDAQSSTMIADLGRLVWQDIEKTLSRAATKAARR